MGNEGGGVQGKDGDASAPGRRSDQQAEGDGVVLAAAEVEAIETSDTVALMDYGVWDWLQQTVS